MYGCCWISAAEARTEGEYASKLFTKSMNSRYLCGAWSASPDLRAPGPPEYTPSTSSSVFAGGMSLLGRFNTYEPPLKVAAAAAGAGAGAGALAPAPVPAPAPASVSAPSSTPVVPAVGGTTEEVDVEEDDEGGTRTTQLMSHWAGSLLGSAPSGRNSKNCERVLSGLAWIISSGGMPRMSTMRQIWSAWLAPPKRGSPVCISTTTQPSDHMSIFWSYGSPRSTSGDR
mmetsp:Transcript_2987/g.6062  ORF Transcript_2987/g.6062 Transcript_2987/m.6062 type:complete len:228 (-) Transcript_2987:919-1602(-)